MITRVRESGQEPQVRRMGRRSPVAVFAPSPADRSRATAGGEASEGLGRACRAVARGIRSQLQRDATCRSLASLERLPRHGNRWRMRWAFRPSCRLPNTHHGLALVRQPDVVAASGIRFQRFPRRRCTSESGQGERPQNTEHLPAEQTLMVRNVCDGLNNALMSLGGLEMRRLVLLLLIMIWACSSPVEPKLDARFLGEWIAESVDGRPLPTTVFTFGNGPLLVRYVARSRKLLIEKSGAEYSGSWRDSTVRVPNGAPEENWGTFQLVTWRTEGNTLHVSCVVKSCIGSFERDFVLRSDGSLEAEIDGGGGPLTVFRKQ